MGIPFQEETAELLSLKTKIIARVGKVKMVTIYYKNGKIRFNEWMKCLEKEEACSFYAPIENNKRFCDAIPLPRADLQKCSRTC